MKRLYALVGTLLFLLALKTSAQTNVLTGNSGDYGVNPAGGITCTLTLLSPNPRVVNGFFVRREPVNATTDANGYFAFTNIIWGRYQFQLSGQWGTTWIAVIPTNSTGPVPLGSYVYPPGTVALPLPDPATNFYTQSQSDAKFGGGNFILKQSGFGTGTLTIQNNSGPQLDLVNGLNTTSVTVDTNGVFNSSATISAPTMQSTTVNGTFGNFTSIQAAFLHGDGSGITGIQISATNSTATNAIGNINGNGTNTGLWGVTTFPPNAVLNAQNASILVSNVIASGPVFANAGLVTTGIGATSLTTSTLTANGVAQLNSDVTVLGNFHAPSNSITYGTNFTVQGLNLIRGRMNGDTISPYTPLSSAPGWSFVVNGSRVLDMTDPGHGGVTFNVPVNGQFVGGFTGGGNPGDFTGNGSALTALGASNLTGNVQVVGLTNALGQMIVGSGSITVTPSGNSIIIGGGGSGPGGSATNAIPNNGGSGTNTFLYTQTTFHGLISGDATGNLLGLTTGASTNLASLGPITNQVLGSKVVGQVAGATNAVNATNLIGTLAATQLTGNVPLAQLTNSGIVTAGLNTTLSTNANGSYAINTAVGTNGLLVPNGMTDYVNSAGYTLSNTITASYSTVDTNNNSYHSGNATIGGTYFGSAGGLTDTATDSEVYLFTNNTASYRGKKYSWPNSTTAGISEIQGTLGLQSNLVAQAPYIKLQTGTYYFTTPIVITNNLSIEGNGMTASIFKYVGPTNIFTSNSVATAIINDIGGTPMFQCGTNALFAVITNAPFGTLNFIGGNYSFKNFAIQASTNFPAIIFAAIANLPIIDGVGFFGPDVGTFYSDYAELNPIDGHGVPPTGALSLVGCVLKPFAQWSLRNCLAMQLTCGYVINGASDYGIIEGNSAYNMGCYLPSGAPHLLTSAYGTNSYLAYGPGFLILGQSTFQDTFINNQTYKCGVSYLGKGCSVDLYSFEDQSQFFHTFALDSISGGQMNVISSHYLSGAPPDFSIMTNNGSGYGFSTRSTDYTSVDAFSYYANGLSPSFWDGFQKFMQMDSLADVGDNNMNVSAPLKANSIYVTNSSRVAGIGLTNGAIVATSFKTPTNASTAGQTIMATSASGDTAWTNFSAAWLTGTLPQATLGSYVVTNGMTNVSLANFKVPTNAPALNNIIRCTTNDSTTAWVDPLGGTPTITINASTMVGTATFVGTPKDGAMIITMSITNPAPAGSSNYITINLAAPALSTNPVVPVLALYGGNTAGSPTNTGSGITGFLNKFQAFSTSNSVIVNAFGAPAISTNTFALHVDRF